VNNIVRIGIGAAFAVIVAWYVNTAMGQVANIGFLTLAAVFGAYMAMNIGANDVANNVGPAVGSGALTIGGAIIIASIWIISTAQEIVHFAVSTKDERLFQVIRFVIVFSIPFICVMFVNTKIYCIARGHARQIRANVPGQNEDSNGRSFTRKMKTAQVIGLLVGTFIFTWLPFFIITIYEQFHDEQQPLLKLNTLTALEIGKMVCASLACSTALFNPLLYGFLRKEVRAAIIRCLKCQNVNQSDFDTTAAEITTRRLEITRK